MVLRLLAKMSGVAGVRMLFWKPVTSPMKLRLALLEGQHSLLLG